MPHKATSRDVAKLAGVSQTTVSYVMSGRRTVAPETERRVLEAMKELGYQPHSGARALRSQKTHVIGLVVPYRHGADAASQHHFITSITSAVRRHSYDILLVTTDEGTKGLQRVINTALCDALFVMEVLTDDPRVELIADANIPTVFFGIPHNYDRVVCVDSDYSAAARGAVELLINAGCSKLFLVKAAHHSLKQLNFLDRFHGAAVEAARELGCEITPIPSAFSYESIATTARSLGSLESSGFIISPIVPTDDWCNAITSLGYELGKDISLVAASWDQEHAHTSIHPAHFDMQLDTLVASGVELIMDQLQDMDSVTPGMTLIAPTFIPGSTLPSPQRSDR